MKVSEINKHLKKAGEHIGRNKDEDNSPKTLNDKNHQASSRKFRKLTYLFTPCQSDSLKRHGQKEASF